MNMKSYSPQAILNRATDLGIALSVEDGKIVVAGSKESVTPKMLEVIRTHKPQLIAYLIAQEREWQATTKMEEALCATCFDLGIETPASVEYEDLMYCLAHHPSAPAPDDAMSREQFLEIVGRLAAQIPSGCAIHVDPPGFTIQDRAREIEREEYEQARLRRSRGVLAG